MEMTSVLNNFWILIPLIAWTLSWKGIALWKAARRNSLGWFVAILILNTVGILEIIYIFFVAKNGESAEEKSDFSEYPTNKKIV
jgi:methionyl-tRNA synthetase